MSIAQIWSRNILQQSPGSTLVRRLPRQQRSRDRYEKIIATAKQLIAERGNDSVSMREIAVAAEMPIASVYQYFPDKNGLLWTLIADVFAKLEQEWDEGREAADSIDALNDAAMGLYDSLINQCEADAFFARLWISVQANAVLAELDQAFNIRMADTYCDKVSIFRPEVRREDIWHRMLLMSTLASTALQLAFQMDADKDRILSEFRSVLSAQLVGATAQP